MNENIINEIDKLPYLLQRESGPIINYYKRKNDIEILKEFKKRWSNFEGKAINEFLLMSESMYTCWEDWKNIIKDYTL